MRSSTRFLVLAAACAAAAACDSPSIPDPVLPRLEIVSGDALTDTVGATLREPLTVVVRDSTGRALQFVQVHFEALGFLDDPYVLPDRRGRDTTDAAGQASTMLQAGIRAGTARLVIRVPALGYEDTATYTVLPGNPARVVALPADTAMYPAKTIAWRAAVVDRYGNPRTDAVTVAAGPGPVAPDGTLLRATGMGRGSWIVRAGELADTGWVSVVPEGRVAAHWLHQVTGDTARMVFVDLDGSGQTSFDIGYWWQPNAQWAPSGAHLLLNDGGPAFGGDSGNHLAFATPAGVGSRVLADDPRIRQSADATYTRDGSWIYFAADVDSVRGLPNDYRRTEIWRVRPNGAGAERVGPAATYYEGDSRPSVSPDGRFVIYSSQRSPEGLRILDLSTGAVRTLAGHSARWSPVDADLVAYSVPASVGGIYGVELRLMRADGTFIRRISPPETVYITFSWSPDGRWLLADRSGSGITDLIEVATGQVLPVTSLHGRLWDPVWKP
jgi:hypothetical protein